MRIVNSRDDLDALRGGPAYLDALLALRGAARVLIDIAEYPANYSAGDYDGPVIEPLWQERQDTSALDKIGVTLEEIEAEITQLTPPA